MTYIVPMWLTTIIIDILMFSFVATRDVTMHILGVISFASRYSDVLHDMVYCVIANFADG